MHPWHFLALAVIGLLCAGILRAAFRLPRNREEWAQVIAFALGGGILAHVATTSYVTSQLLGEVNERLADRSGYRQALSSVEGIRDPDVQKVFQRGVRDIDNQLHGIAAGSLTIDRNDVFTYWEQLIGNSKEQIEATNLVSDADWELFGPGGAGTPPQRVASTRGVRITRVMIFDPKVADHREGLRRTACYQLQQIPSLKVFEISLERLDRPPYQGWLRTLNSPDIVIFDRKLLLMTKTIDKDRTIDSSRLTTDELLLSTAREFYGRLLQDAVPVQCAAS